MVNSLPLSLSLFLNQANPQHHPQSKDSSYTYIHFLKPHHADLFEEFNRPPHLPHEDIHVSPQHQPPNPEDEDDIVPDQHAAFGITRATQAKREVVWRELGMERLVDGGPGTGEGGEYMMKKKEGGEGAGVGVGDKGGDKGCKGRKMGVGMGLRLPR